MLEFQAAFWDINVSINKKDQYLNNEILVRYLNGHLDYLKPECDKLRAATTAILLPTDTIAGAVDAAGYDERVQSIQKLLNSIDRKCLTLPPYSLTTEEVERHHNQLFDCLNRHHGLFADTSSCRDASGALVHFYPVSISISSRSEKYQSDVLALNEDIQRTIAPYIRWLEDILRLRAVYVKLLEYLHSKHAFLSPQEMVKQLESYWQHEDNANKPHQRLGAPQPVSVSYEVFSPVNSTPVLADCYTFDSLGAFLYTDFFRGLKNNYLPQKCANCREWFLLPHGQYSDYCNRTTFGTGKAETCRSLGARKKYNQKCKTDPVWLAYNRAYKAHYARFSKGKMTRTEFKQWGMYAIGLRAQALEGSLPFEEYQQMIKK